MIRGPLRDRLAAGPWEVRFDEPLSRYTTYRIGGPAAALVIPTSPADVSALLTAVRDASVPWLAIGLGSNLLVSDSGFDGVVLRFGKELAALEAGDGDAPLWTAGAGLPTPLLARRSAAAGLAGIHRLVGVPGTIGGGVAMNAGAHGQEFRRVVDHVRVVAPDGTVRDIKGSDVPWRYRSSGLEGQVVVSATFRLTPADPEQLAREVRQHFEWRKAGTPFDEPCCGSVFRNPEGAGGRTAGQLIDGAGLKRFRIGGAEVSPMHANYIVNVGGASASDVRKVIEAVREKVRREFGVELELEVKLVGEP